ncbi:MAG: HigA family addiction module antitoxin [Cyclobacteriaceae bacterium]
MDPQENTSANPTSAPTTAGQLLRQVMDNKGILHVEVAKQLGVSRGVLSRYVNGTRNFTPKLALRLEAILGVPAEEYMKLQITSQLKQLRAAQQR